MTTGVVLIHSGGVSPSPRVRVSGFGTFFFRRP
jgi:hypothetical protein